MISNSMRTNHFSTQLLYQLDFVNCLNFVNCFSIIFKLSPSLCHGQGMEDKRKTKAIRSKGLLQTVELYQYVLDTSVYPREPEPLRELRAITTACHPRAIMATAPDAGQHMSLLLEIVNAKKTIEIGVFTGYSLLLTALTIPHDGNITAIDPDRSSYEIGLPIIKRSGVEHKINFIESQALPVLDQLLENPENQESFDFAYVDADKINYANYHERLLKLLRPGGIVVYDNTLWGGTVAMRDDFVAVAYSATYSASRNPTIKFNKLVAADSRVHISQVPLGDGITVCRRL